MSQKKIVRFYEPVKVDQQDQVVMIGSDFWTKLLTKLAGMKDSNDRIFLHSGARYFGEQRRAAASPKRRYLYAGRLRDRDDWPDSFDANTGTVANLSVPGLLVEPTYIVPFGTHNYCAVLTPRLGGIRQSALERWLTGACGLLSTADRVELRPLISKDVKDKLENQAVGATTLSVRFAKDVDFGGDTGGGDVGAAMRGAAAGATADMSAEVRYSFGHASGSSTAQSKLLTAARWLASKSYADRASVSMLLPVTDSEDSTVTYRSEAHDLIKDRITYAVPVEAPAGRTPSEASVLGAIEDAIQRFNADH